MTKIPRFPNAVATYEFLRNAMMDKIFFKLLFRYDYKQK